MYQVCIRYIICFKYISDLSSVPLCVKLNVLSYLQDKENMQ